MTEQECNAKMNRLDDETKKKFDGLIPIIYTQFRGMSYSKAELLIEHLKRLLKKDACISGQGWEIPPTV